MHIEIAKDIAYTFEREYFIKGIQQVPSSGTAIVYDNNGGEAQASTVLSIDAAGKMSFSFTAENNDKDDRNFKIKWSFVVTNTIIQYQLFDVVINPLTNNITDKDLFDYLPDLNSDIKELFGETTSIGSTTTLVSTRLTADKRDWTGGFIEIYIDGSTVHYARISTYASGTVTFTPAYSVAIASELKYRIRTSYQDFIDKAYEQHVWQDLRNKRQLASGYIDGSVVDNLIIFKTIEIISRGKKEILDDTWDLRYNDAKKEYNEQLQKLYEPYDTSEDGNVDNIENNERPNFTSIEVQR